MKSPVTFPALLALGAFLALPLHAQYDMPPAPSQAPPPPANTDNSPYGPPSDQAAPPPNQQPGPDQGGPGPQGGPDQGAPDQSANFQTFYDNLGQQGTWIQTADYGYVWQPNVNDPNWAPYTEGHWVYSDAGWTWASDEPWGWATYHYGRWVNLDGTGWCWVPGYTWAPAWVSWRYGDGYCGWAPLPPDSFVGIDYGSDGFDFSLGFHIGGDCDSYYGIGAGCYHFVPCTYLGHSNYHGHYANPYNNYALINRTTNVTNLNVNRNGANGGHGRFGGVTTGGPSFEQINAVAQTPVQRVTLANSSHPGGGTVTNNSLALFAPRVSPGATGKPALVSGSLERTTVNRGVDVTRPLAVNRSLAAPAPTQSQIQAAQLAQFNAPARAKVVTTSTPVTPLLQTPLATMKPVATATPQTNSVTQRNTAGQSFNGEGNSSHAENQQGRSFYQITHPTAAPSNYSSTHSQATPGGPQQTSTQTVNQHGGNNTPVQSPQSTPNTTVTTVHSQTTPAPQSQSAPVTTHHHEDNNSQQNNQSTQPQPSSNQQQQSQSYPAPTYNNQGGGNGGGSNHNNQGGNGGNSWGNRNQH